MDIRYDAVAQTQESDLHFLQRLAEEANGSFAIRDNTVLIFPPNLHSRPKTTLVYTESCTNAFTLADRGKYKKVKAKWWDAVEAEEKTIEANQGEGEAAYTIKKRFRNASEAKVAAENKAELLRRGTIQGSLTVPGDASIVAGAEIMLEGFKPEELNGAYLGTNVQQSMSKSGWTTRVTLERL